MTFRTKESAAGIIPGETYYRWKVLGHAFSRGSYSQGHLWSYVCECACGQIKVIYASNLKSGRSSKCESCKGLAYRVVREPAPDVRKLNAEEQDRLQKIVDLQDEGLLSKIIDGIQVMRIPNYPRFWISSHGHLWSSRIYRKEIVGWCKSSSPGPAGHTCFRISNDTEIKTFSGSHLVALAWIGPHPPNKSFALHKSSKKDLNGFLDDCVLNLYWGDAKDNSADYVRELKLKGG